MNSGHFSIRRGHAYSPPGVGAMRLTGPGIWGGAPTDYWRRDIVVICAEVNGARCSKGWCLRWPLEPRLWVIELIVGDVADE